MAYLAAQFGLYLLVAAGLGVVIGWTVARHRGAAADGSRPASRPTEVTARTLADTEGRRSRPATQAARPVPVAAQAQAAPPTQVAPPAAPTLSPPPPPAPVPQPATPTAQDQELDRLRRQAAQLETELAVLRAAATASPLSRPVSTPPELAEVIDRQRRELDAKSMELATLRARYEGARHELDRIHQVDRLDRSGHV